MNSKLTWLAFLAVFTLAAGCGGNRNQSTTDRLVADVDEDVDLYSKLTGIDETTPVNIEEDEQEKPSAESQGDMTEGEGDHIGGTQGGFIAKMLVSGEEVKGSYSISTATNSPTIVRSDVRTGEEIRLDPGKYDFTFTTTKITGNPEFTLRDVDIPVGRRVTREVKIPTGDIKLVTGAKCKKRAIRIRQKGATDWYKGKFFTCKTLTLLAGEYEAELIGGKGGNTTVSGIQVYDGGKRDITIRPE